MGFGVGVELSVVEQRYWAVLAALAGESVTSVATQLGVSCQTLHTWLDRYDDEGLAGLVDRSHRPESRPHQSPAEVEAVVREMRREHPRRSPRADVYGRDGQVRPGARTTPDGSRLRRTGDGCAISAPKAPGNPSTVSTV
jgi:transposase-like protein